MARQYLYLALCVLGTALPYSHFVPYLMLHGFNIQEMIGVMFYLPLSGFAWWDVIISAVVLLIFVFAEGRKLGMKHLWAPVVALGVGVSLSLPLFLYMRERHLVRADS